MKTIKENKKNVDSTPEIIESTNNNSTNNMEKNKKKKKSGKKKYSLESTARTLSIKCYEEQMPEGFENLKIQVRNIDSTKYIVVLIKHDKDTIPDTFWKVATEKSHYHIYVKVLKNGVKIRTILNMLNIVYRPGLDDEMWENHGVEPCADFSACCLYATHDTDKAISEGKYQYPIDDIITNISLKELQFIRSGAPDKKKIKQEDKVNYDRMAYQSGYSLEDWEDFWNNLPFSIREHTNLKTVYKDRHSYGLETRIAEMDKKVNRKAIFIHGDRNLGKTYTSTETLKSLVNKVVEIDGGKTGKYDKVTPSTNALVINDDRTEYLLQIADNRVVNVYHRNKGNSYFVGEWFIITSNKEFNEWIEECSKTDMNEEERKAVESRFYICTTKIIDGHIRLILEKEAQRGTLKDREEKNKDFKEFFEKYNEKAYSYIPEENKEEINFQMEELKQYNSKVEELHQIKQEITELNDIKLQQYAKFLALLKDYNLHTFYKKKKIDIGDIMSLATMIRTFPTYSENIFYDIIKDRINDIYDFLYQDLIKNEWKDRTMINTYALFQNEYPEEFIIWEEQIEEEYEYEVG